MDMYNILKNYQQLSESKSPLARSKRKISEGTNVNEKAVSKKQQKFMGMVHAAQKGEKPASKEVEKVAKSMSKSDVEDFAATKQKGLPEKKEVDETTSSGSVATAAPAASNSSSIYGKGIYESLEQAFCAELARCEGVTESLNVNVNIDDNARRSIAVTATDGDVDQISDIVKLSGLFGDTECDTCSVDSDVVDYVDSSDADTYSSEYTDEYAGNTMDFAVDTIDSDQIEHEFEIDEDYSNSPDEQYGSTDLMVNKLSGGLNGPKRQVNPNNPADNPLAMKRISKGPSGQVDLGLNESARVIALSRKLLS